MRCWSRRIAVVALAIVCAGLANRSAGAQAAPTGTFAGTPAFSAAGQAAAVFLGGSVTALESAARASGANGVWAQDASGAFELLLVDGPAFLREAFAARFPAGFASATAVTLTRAPGTTSAPTPAPSPGPSTPRPTPPGHGGVPGPSAND